MALGNFGYGRWDAPYWFIGPEQGKRRNEDDDLRPKAWRELGSRELCDCEEFSRAINEHAWHRDGVLQRTWRPLILLLMTYLERPTDTESLRHYQRSRWGKTNGETCVIELSGLAAPSLATPIDRESFLQERIAVIRKKIHENQPKLVVMYGTALKHQMQSWEAIAGSRLLLDNILISDETKLVVTPHPQKRGLCDVYWKELGERLRCPIC